MKWTHTVLAGMLAVALTAGPACALEGRQVLVVANGDESLDLAKAYMQLRGIPAENLVQLETTSEYEISRAGFEKQIRQPILQHIADNKLQGHIRCICLMYGVPVRIAPAKLPPEYQPIFATYRNAAKSAAARLALDQELARTVCRKYPKPRTDQLRPVDKLFNPVEAPADNREFGKLLGETLSLLAQKQGEVKKLHDVQKQRIASRQLMALYLDVGGLSALVTYVKQDAPPDAPDLDAMGAQLALMEQQYVDLRGKPFSAEIAKAEIDLADRMLGLTQLHAMAVSKSMLLGPESTDASVDSELALLWWDNRYNPGGWVPNLLNWRHDDQAARLAAPVLMSARLDGPSKADVMRMIRASVAAEKTGLDGTMYIDGGGPQPSYDARLVDLAKFVRAKTNLPVTLDRNRRVFAPGSCPNAALYVGWHSPQRYVPSFIWAKGAVGWHISSSEATELRKASSRQWCTKMIQNGVAATIGSVNEPYLGAFPLSDEFFPMLLTGKWTLAECYWRTTPMASWRLTLIGDPLYNPFANSPRLDVKDLPQNLLPKPAPAATAARARADER